MSECGIASLTHANRFQYSEPGDFGLEATAFIAEHLTAISAMVFPLVKCEPESDEFTKSSFYFAAEKVVKIPYLTRQPTH